MGITSEMFVQLTCERCGHKWKPILPNNQLPKKCPGCQAANWDKPIQYPLISKARKAYFKERKKNKSE